MINISGWASFAAWRAAPPTTQPKLGSCASPSVSPRNGRLQRPGQRNCSGPLPRQGPAFRDAYQQRQEQARDTVLLGRLGELKEVGYLAIYLASLPEIT